VLREVLGLRSEQLSPPPNYPLRDMTQRDDASVPIPMLASNTPSEAEEPRSVIQLISEMRAEDEAPPSAAEGSEPSAAEGSEPLAAEGSEPLAAEGSEPLAAEGSEPSAAAPVSQGDPAAKGDADGVRPTLMGLAPVEDQTQSEQTAEAEQTDSQIHSAHNAHGEDEAQPAATVSVDAAPAAESDAVIAHALQRTSTDATWVGPYVAADEPRGLLGRGLPGMPRAPRTLAEAEAEWLELSTKWLVATGPERGDGEQLLDDAEVTNPLHWSDHMAARVLLPRAEPPSSPPPPPAQQPGRRRNTIGFGTPLEASALPAQPQYQQPAAPAPTRRATLAGISPLSEDWEQPRPALPTQPFVTQPQPADGPQPWREEPSFTAKWAGPSRGAPSTSSRYATAPTTPTAPTRTASYGLPPAVASGSRSAPQPWAATGQYSDFAPPRRDLYNAARPRHSQPPQAYSSEITLEQWKNLANGWIGAVGKLAIAGMALHYSGLAVPLLAMFGYAPANVAASAIEPAPKLAAAGVIAEPVSPRVFARPQPEAREEKAEAVELEDEPPAPVRRRYTRRDASEGRRRSAKAAHAQHAQHHAQHVQKPKAAQPAPAVEEPTPPPAAAAPAPVVEEPAGEALLRINSRPWSQVYIDGTLVGNTPKMDLRVSAGAHRIRLVNPDLGLSKTIELNAAAGETVTHVQLLDE
jgi:hypothetical protein